MDLFSQLAATIAHEHRHGELPDNLLEPLQQVATNPQQFSAQHSLVQTLLRQLQAFEPYCDCGCFAEGFNSRDLCKTLGQLGVALPE